MENPNEIVDFAEIIPEFNRKQQEQGLKILMSSQMLSRLPISLAQLKAGNNSDKLRNEIRQLLYSLYRSKTFIKVWWHYLKLVTIFMNSRNSKKSEPHIFRLDLTDKRNFEHSRKTWL